MTKYKSTVALIMTAFSGVNLSVVTPVFVMLRVSVSCLSVARPCRHHACR